MEFPYINIQFILFLLFQIHYEDLQHEDCLNAQAKPYNSHAQVDLAALFIMPFLLFFVHVISKSKVVFTDVVHDKVVDHDAQLVEINHRHDEKSMLTDIFSIGKSVI